jgi:hypothetical protein
MCWPARTAYLNATQTARRFAQTIRSPLLLDTMLRGAMLSDLTMQMTAAVLGNLLDPEGRGILERTVRITDRALRALTERST